MLALPSAGDDEVHGLGSLSLLVGLDIEGNALTLGQRLQSGLLDRGNVNENIARTIVGLDEAIAPFAVEELDRTGLRHRETPFPVLAPPPARMARRLGRTFAVRGKRRPQSASVAPRPPFGGGTSKPALRVQVDQNRAVLERACTGGKPSRLPKAGAAGGCSSATRLPRG